MATLLPAWPMLMTFLAASLVLAITPGPGVLYIVSRGLSQGRRAGIASVLGVAIGNFGNAVAASLGLAAWFAVSSVAYDVVRYAGAAYLAYLGISALVSRSSAAASDTAADRRSNARVVRDGAIVALLNPKTLLFFAAFLPQFLNPSSPAASGVLMGAIFVAIALTTDTLYALLAGSIAPLIQRRDGARAFGRALSGTVYLALGAYAALSRQGR